MPVKLSSSTAVDKALQLYDMLLFSRRPYSARELAECLQCSKSTVSRLISQVEARCPGNFERVNRDGREWYRLRRAGNPGAVISHEDLERLGRAISNPRNFLSPEEAHLAQGTVERLEALYGYSRGMPAGALQTVTKTWVDYSGKQDVIADLLAAIRERRVVRVFYRRGHQQERDWLVAPVRLISSTDAIYLDGWFVEIADGVVSEASGKRSLKIYIQRIVRVEPTAFTHTFRIEETEHYFGVMTWDEPFTARIRFDACVADYVRDRNFSEPQEKEELEDGSLVLTLRSRSEGEVISMVLGYGATAEILEPAGVREKVRAALGGALARYAAPAEGDTAGS